MKLGYLVMFGGCIPDDGVGCIMLSDGVILSFFRLLYLYYFRHTSQLTTRLYHGKISES